MEECELYIITMPRLTRAFKGNADVAQEMKLAAFDKMTALKEKVGMTSYRLFPY